MIRTQIYLPKSQLHQLKKAAQAHETTVSALLRELIAGKLEPSRQQHARGGLVKAAKRICTLKTSGPSDLARNMDQYLYGDM